jgi:hypothetical protein
MRLATITTLLLTIGTNVVTAQTPTNGDGGGVRKKNMAPAEVNAELMKRFKKVDPPTDADAKGFQKGDKHRDKRSRNDPKELVGKTDEEIAEHFHRNKAEERAKLEKDHEDVAGKINDHHEGVNVLTEDELARHTKKKEMLVKKKEALEKGQTVEKVGAG